MQRCAEDIDSDSESDKDSNSGLEEGDRDQDIAQEALNSAVYVFSRTLIEQSFD
jgi:hypothetical protein